MTRRLFALIGMLAAMAWPIAAHGDITTYTQDFEGLNQGAANALANDGWFVYANVFGPGGNYLYGYGTFSAPNGGSGFSSIAGGPAQGGQYLNVYSDYNNVSEHNAGNYVDALVFQERTIGATNVGVGKSFSFAFDYLKNGGASGVDGNARTFAFVKVLDPLNGYATLGITEFETTGASATAWTSQTLNLAATNPAWNGKLLQFGFRSYATNFNRTGRFYDNLNFSSVPEPSSVGLISLGLAGLGFRRRRDG